MKILLIDDDETFCATLARALTRRGLQVQTAHTPVDALNQVQLRGPTHAILDLKLGEEASGLDLIEPLLAASPKLEIVVLTGYASIATTVTAMKRGATGYLAKPVDVTGVLAALGYEEATQTGPNSATNKRNESEERMSLKRLEWEHINRVLAEHEGNVSAAARTLGLYRRTLQRKLDKRPTKD